MIAMPLTVSIDETRTVESANSDEKYIVYQIHVRGGAAHLSQTVERRFREFEGLHARLSAQISIPHLPRVISLHRRSAKITEQRRHLLEIYLKEIVKRCQQLATMPEDLVKFLRLPPYDQDHSNAQKLEEQSREEEMKFVLEHAPCVAVQDYLPWNNDHRENFSDSILSGLMHALYDM